MSDSGYKVTKIKLNKTGVKELLQSQEIMTMLESVAPQLGEIDATFVGHDRCHVQIKEK